MKKIGFLVMPLMAVSFLASCNNGGGGNTPEQAEFMLSGDHETVVEGKSATVYVDWKPTNTIKFESFTFAANPEKDNTTSFEQAGNPRPMPVTITFKAEITESINGTLSFAYEDITTKTKCENSIDITIPKPEPGETFNITWVNYDDTKLEVNSVKKGEIPVYDGIPPKKPSSNGHVYTFVGWIPEVKEVTEQPEVPYKAVFEEKNVTDTTIKISIPNEAEDKTFEFIYKSRGDIEVNWGDDDVYYTNTSTHTYQNSGDYTITIKYITDLWVYNVDYWEETKGEDFVKEVTLSNLFTSIENYAFYYCTSITTIHLPNTITYIGYDAFCGCDALTDINIPEGVTYIDESAFYNCESLASIVIPNSINYISSDAFEGCTLTYTNDGYANYLGNNDNKYLVLVNVVDSTSATTSYTIEDGCKIIFGGAFSGCSSLTSINIPNSITNVGNNAFSDCDNLVFTTDQYAKYLGNSTNNHLVLISALDSSSTSTSYEIKDGCKVIGNYAFEECSSLVSVNIPDSVTSFGKGVFYECSSLKNVNIPNGVSMISYNAFNECSSLESINIPNSVTLIDYSAFMECENLSSINIPEGVTKINDEAFSSCTSLTNITIPSTVTHIGEDAIAYCESINSVKISIYNPVYDSRNNCCAVIESATNSIVFGYVNTIIPDTVTAIGTSAFGGCLFEEFTIPDSITYIGVDAFEYTSLTSVKISTSVILIDYGAFSLAFSLTSVDLTDFTIPDATKIPSAIEGAFDRFDGGNALFEVADQSMANIFASKGGGWPNTLDRYNWQGK